MTQDEWLHHVERVLRLGGADDISVAYLRRRLGATRFAGSCLTQCSETDEPVVEVRVAIGGRVGTSRTGDLALDALSRAHREAVEAAKARPPVAKFPGFPDAQPIPVLGGWAEATARAGAAERVDALRPIFAEADARGLACAGILLTSEVERGVASTRGVRGFARQTFAKMDMIAADGDASGQAGGTHADLARLDPASVARRAFDRAERSRDPVDVEPGVYDVLLEPAAVSEVLEWLGVTTFGARTILDGTSAVAGRLGEKLFGENITIVDDPRSAADGAVPRPFDSEGVPSQRVVLVERGVARGYVSDTLTAARLGTRSTGHAPHIGEDFAEGPIPTHLRLEPGDVPRADLPKVLGRGLLVTRFHYVNGLLDTRNATMTGLTRDGLYVVKDGEPGRAARNLRWTQSMLEALGRVDAIARELRPVPTWWSEGSAFFAPAIVVRGWRFTGTAG